jgi:hypothetical protein
MKFSSLPCYLVPLTTVMWSKSHLNQMSSPITAKCVERNDLVPKKWGALRSK